MAIVVISMLTTAVSFPVPVLEYIFTSFTVMNMSHVLTEFSFGKHFPEMTQPLDNSFEVTQDSASLLLLESFRFADVPAEFVAYQYYLRVVPTTYVAPRSRPLQTNQYSVTHYERQLKPHLGVPGIFFKFDVEPVRLTLIQRTTTFAQFFIRCVTSLPPSHHLISFPSDASASSVAYSSAHHGASAQRTA